MIKNLPKVSSRGRSAGFFNKMTAWKVLFQNIIQIAEYNGGSQVLIFHNNFNSIIP